MTAPLVILGDTKSILRLGPASLRNEKDWTHMDSDVLAHFLQVDSQIAKSRWAGAQVSYTTQGDKLLKSSFPALEDFVYAAVYVRQFILKQDDLFNDAVERYLHYVDCPIRRTWIKAEQKGFAATLAGKCFMLDDYTVREVFDAFIYGAGLMHSSPHLRSPTNRERFRKLDDRERREKVLYALHTSLRRLLNHCSRVATVIYQDLGRWIEDHGLPRPDVRWHDRLFRVES